MKTLNNTQLNNLKQIFLEHVGNKIKEKRERKSISAETLAKCLGMTKQSIYLYEKGKTDFPVTMLPLISTYCDFPITEYFDKEMAQTLTGTFNSLVEITKHKYQRTKFLSAKQQSMKKNTINGKIVKGYVVDDNGEDEFITSEDVEQNIIAKEPTLRERYIKGEINVSEQPFTEREFAEYLDTRSDSLTALDGAYKFLNYIGDTPQKETFKGCIADFVIKELIVEPVLKDENKQTKRAYAYYKYLLEGKELPKEDDNRVEL